MSISIRYKIYNEIKREITTILLHNSVLEYTPYWVLFGLIYLILDAVGFNICPNSVSIDLIVSNNCKIFIM